MPQPHDPCGRQPRHRKRPRTRNVAQGPCARAD
jgi:hypothetical protein